MCKQSSWGIDNSIVPPSRQPKTTTTTRQVTREVYDENGKLIEKIVETTTDTVTVDNSQPYITWNGTGPIGIQYSVDPTSQGKTIANGVKQALEMVDRVHTKRR